MKVASLQSYQLSFDWLFEHEICRIFVFGCDIGLQGTPIKGIAWLWASPTGPFGCGAIHDQLGHSMRCLACSKRKNVVRIVAIEWKKNHGQWVKTEFSHFWLIFIPCYMWFFAFHWPYNQHSDGIFTPAWQFSSSFHTLPVGQVPVHLPGRFQHWTPRDSPNSNRENAGNSNPSKTGAP